MDSPALGLGDSAPGYQEIPKRSSGGFYLCRLLERVTVVHSVDEW